MTGQDFAELRLEGVSRRFGDRLALDGLDLTITAGEFVTLLGPSGCGKSTALNCLAGLLPLSGGRILADGRRIDTVPPERRGFGMVFQNYALFPHLTVRANVAFGLRMRRVGRAETAERVARALDLVRLGEFADRLPAQLSGGQQQRVAIARAVVVEPALVLMDEPLSNLDAELRLSMRAEIRRLHQSLGLTTVYVTHDQEEALSLSDRLVVLRDGVVQQVGSPEELYTAPVNAYVAGFMGYRNLLTLDCPDGGEGEVPVRGHGLALTGTAREPVPTGPVSVAVRPEDIDVGEGPNAARVRVEVAEYHGRQMAVEAVLDSGARLRFRTGRRLAPGDEVTVRVDTDRVRVFPAEGSASPAATESAPVGGRP